MRYVTVGVVAADASVEHVGNGVVELSLFGVVVADEFHRVAVEIEEVVGGPGLSFECAIARSRRT
ncbi:hypothetical protein AB0D74_35145 [Streptomyces sp. NPDC048278]|uniref:hypothetical protein n=1 Tax=Streptomyces sp. NPDC048278 TaxID=3155809 RepID=UPI0034132CD2